MIDIVAGMKAAASLKNFIEKGQLEEAIGSINLSAALTSVRKALRAEDPRSQLWSSVNHLESAEEAFRRIEERPSLIYVNAHRYARACHDRVFVLCLLAICYKYLGEMTLSQASFESAIECHRTKCAQFDEDGDWRPAIDDPQFWRKWRRSGLLLVTNIPVNIIDGLRDDAGIKKIDPRDVQQQLHTMPIA